MYVNVKFIYLFAIYFERTPLFRRLPTSESGYVPHPEKTAIIEDEIPFFKVTLHICQRNDHLRDPFPMHALPPLYVY